MLTGCGEETVELMERKLRRSRGETCRLLYVEGKFGRTCMLAGRRRGCLMGVGALDDRGGGEEARGLGCMDRGIAGRAI